MINVSDLGMSFGKQLLFEKATFQLNQGNRYGLVGANGSGKSTLLKILSGEVHPESGDIGYPSSIRLGILRQDHFVYEECRILDVVLMGKPDLWEALRKKEELIAQPETSERDGRRLADLEMVIADLNGYQADSDASELLSGLGIHQRRQLELLSSLSGGYKLRVLLAQCLFSEPDFLLLDEPTNHLDIASIQWLEDYLSRFSGTCLVISHDQYFLNRVCTHIIDIDYGEIKIYSGNYNRFQGAKALEVSQKEAGIERQEKKKAELQQFITRFKAKATKARQANSKAKQIDRMEEIVIKRSSRISPSFKFDIRRPSGKIAFSVEKLSKSYDGKPVLTDVSLSVKRGDKIAVIGPNGIGKSTLVKMLEGEVLPTAGRVEMGHEIYPGYCPQDHRDIIPRGTTPFEWLYSFAPAETIGTIRGILGRVLLRGDDVDKDTESLSGGESSRLIFSRVMLEKPNLLLLDEPTNHMDIESLEALGEALRKYEGTIVCVSHDRRFIEKFATAILELHENGFELFWGSYSDYLEKFGNDYLDRATAPLSANSFRDKKGTSKKRKEWKRASREVARLNRAIEKKETEISMVEVELSQQDEQLLDNRLYLPENKGELDAILVEKEKYERRLVSLTDDWESLQRTLDEITAETGDG